MDKFKEIDFEYFKINPFEKIGKEWMTITAKKEDITNTMTASWGGLGVMWGKNVSFIGIRPGRYTKEFVDDSDKFSLCFFDEEYRKYLSYFGSVSGRDEDKIANSQLSIIDCDDVPLFQDAYLVLICKKLYKQDLAPEGFVDCTLDDKWYPNKDYHTLYVSEIEKILIRN